VCLRFSSSSRTPLSSAFASESPCQGSPESLETTGFLTLLGLLGPLGPLGLLGLLGLHVAVLYA
jgi:hypothetical protein